MDDANELLRLLRLTIKQMRVDDDEEVRRAHAAEVAEHFDVLDSHLSAGGWPPEAWREGPDAPDHPPVWWEPGEEGQEPPDGFGLFAHWSTVHDGVNVEMDVPDGLRVTVHYNEWLAVDAVAGEAPNHGEPLDNRARGVCGARHTDMTGPWTHHFFCTQGPGHEGDHEDETRHGAPAAKWGDAPGEDLDAATWTPSGSDPEVPA
jgi:hypothetical protein